jgi:hypothetical protein
LRDSETLRFGRVLTFRSIAIIGKGHLAALYNRIEQLEWLSFQGTSVEPQTLKSAKPKSRSVVFLHNSYYNFYYLAAALRERGWDALSVSVDDPKGTNARFSHGSDLCLYDPHEERMRKNVDEFFRESLDRFRMVHFYGRGQMSFFPSEYDTSETFSSLPLAFMKLKQRGVKIGYSVCGCLDAVSQSAVHRWSNGCCDRCIWKRNPRVCGDRLNLAWGHKIQTFCDLIACEGFPALDYQSGSKAYREPLTTALDPEFWRPDLDIPSHLVLPRREGELIVYHAVGNYELRSDNERNVKGTKAIMEALNRLRGEGLNVRLEFVTNLPSKDVRFIQLQSDIVVDQLNHGRYGANAREAMMLGRPTICHINQSEPLGELTLESIRTCPLVSANETTIYDVLRDLLLDKKRRLLLGTESRRFALKWHSAASCAARFERVFDRLMMGLPPSADLQDSTNLLAAKSG